jgi:hypothetical protein
MGLKNGRAGCPSSDYAGLRRSARVATARRARRASLTDFESGKASANSGSRSTTLVPRRYRSTYLPRTPPEKSYSALISTVLRLEVAFFILSSLLMRCRACADQADPLTSNSMDHNQQTSLISLRSTAKSRILELTDSYGFGCAVLAPWRFEPLPGCSCFSGGGEGIRTPGR